jgi:flagellar hook-associated protein 1 FlgK
MSQGVVGVGYSVPTNLDLTAETVTITTPAPSRVVTGLDGLLGTGSEIWTATFSDGTSLLSSDQVPTDKIPVTRDGATLSRISFSSMSFDIAGTPNIGDKFTILENIGGVQDSRNAVLLAKLQTQNTTDGGVATFQASYARLVADNGIQTREAKIQLEARTGILKQTQASRDSLSAVNLDEEAANMLKFQQAYQASSKILAIGSKLFESILAIG